MSLKQLNGGKSLSNLTPGTLNPPLNLVTTNSVTAANTQLLARTVTTSPQIVANVPGAVGDVVARFSVQVQGVERGLINATGVVSATGVFCAGAGAANSPVEFRAGTSDGSDTAYALFSGGGGWADPLNQPLGGDAAPGYTRGSSLYLYGNEHATLPAQAHHRCATGGLYRWFVNEVESVRISALGVLGLYNTGGFAGTISPVNLTANRAFTLPNTAGELMISGGSGSVSISNLTSGTLVSSAVMTFPSNQSITTSSRQVGGYTNGLFLNTPSGTGIYGHINGTEHFRIENSTSTGLRISGGLPLTFATNGTVAGVRAVIGLNDGIALLAAAAGSHTMYVNTFLEYTFSASAFTLGDGNNIAVGTGTGTIIFTSPTQKGGFWGATPVVQPAFTGTSTTLAVAGSTNALFADSTSTGGTGSAAYSFPDLIRNLKAAGILAA